MPAGNGAALRPARTRLKFANYLHCRRCSIRESLHNRAAVTASQNRYDTARIVESYLQNKFGYTLEQKAGGSDPLADFLFNVREGHCEYFATAMAVMLRTQGIATRIVNGFQRRRIQ